MLEDNPKEIFEKRKQWFDRGLSTHGMRSGYITLLDDFTVLIEGCKLSSTKLQDIAKLATEVQIIPLNVLDEEWKDLK